MENEGALHGGHGVTAKQVEHAKPGAKRYEMPVRSPAGLYLVVHPTGKKGWCLRYRWHGQPRNLTFLKGYPDMSLAAARAEAEAKLEDLRNDKDPAVIQAEEIVQDQPNTAKAVAHEWLDRTMKGKASHDELKRLLDRDVLPEW